MRAGIRRVLLMFGAIVVMFNWRWDLWLAAVRGTDLAEIHSLLPAWVVPLLTLGVVIWIGVVSIITKPKAA
jgi:hypothetical protein